MVATGHGKGLQPCFTIREDLTDRVGQIYARKFVRSSSFALVALVVLGEVLRKMSASSPQQLPPPSAAALAQARLLWPPAWLGLAWLA